MQRCRLGLKGVRNLCWAACLFGGVASALAQSTGAEAPAPADAAVASAGVQEYRLGPGDGIRIVVYQSPDLSLESRVTEAGTITYPLLGEVPLGGLTQREAEALLAKGLRDGGFVRSPQVILTISQYKAHQINVLGMVARPGRYPMDVAHMRFTEVLAMVGGVSPDAGADVVVVLGKRNGQPVRLEIDVPSIFAAGRVGQDDVLVMPGDVIWVERVPQVYLQGEVMRPGQMRLGRNMTLLHVLAAAGGVTQRGTLRGLKISRRNAQGAMDVIEEPPMESTLRDGDVILVRESLF